MSKSIEQIQTEALEALRSASDHKTIDAISVRYIGRKGIITQFLRSI